MEKKSRREIWHPPAYTKRQIRAVQAIHDCALDPEKPQPSADDCKVFMDWLLIDAAATYADPFRPGQKDVSDYMLGRRSVGLAVIKLSQLKPELFK